MKDRSLSGHTVILRTMMYVFGAFNNLLIFPCAKIHFAVLLRQLLLLRCPANDLNRTSQAVADHGRNMSRAIESRYLISVARNSPYCQFSQYLRYCLTDYWTLMVACLCPPDYPKLLQRSVPPTLLATSHLQKSGIRSDYYHCLHFTG